MQKKILFILIGLTLVSCSKSNPKTSVSSYSSYESISNNEISFSTSLLETSSSSEKENISSKEEYKRKIKVYINPSVQMKNMYVGSRGSEAKNMYEIALLMDDILSKVPYLEVKTNLSYLSLTNSTYESNSYQADIHLALHSNAGGGRGSEIYTINSKAFTKAIYEDYVQTNTFPRRGIKDGTKLFELKAVKAPHSSLIELAFHDNEEEAKWICSSYYEIAKSLSDSICSFAKEIIEK